MKFSQRIGKTAFSKEIQLESIDTELRTGLWNVLKIAVIDPQDKAYWGRPERSYFYWFCMHLWMNHYRIEIDKIPNTAPGAESFIKLRFFQCEWFEVYDFVEFISEMNQADADFDIDKFRELCNSILEREFSGYRLIGKTIAKIINSTEIEELELSITNTKHLSSLKGANTHLLNSLEKLSSRDNPDYRNSIKESISAVESTAKVIASLPTATLADALNAIKEKINIHPALEKGFKNIYGYTGDGEGIRHGLMNKDNLSFEDAKFMLVACSAFINYLIVKAERASLK